MDKKARMQKAQDRALESSDYYLETILHCFVEIGRADPVVEFMAQQSGVQ